MRLALWGLSVSFKMWIHPPFLDCLTAPSETRIQIAMEPSAFVPHHLMASQMGHGDFFDARTNSEADAIFHVLSAHCCSPYFRPVHGHDNARQTAARFLPDQQKHGLPTSP